MYREHRALILRHGRVSRGYATNCAKDAMILAVCWRQLDETRDALRAITCYKLLRIVSTKRERGTEIARVSISLSRQKSSIVKTVERV